MGCEPEHLLEEQTGGTFLMEQERKLSQHTVIMTLYLPKARGSLSWALSFPCLDSERGADDEWLDGQGQKTNNKADEINSCL